MPYTLWSRGRLLGETDLGFVQVFDNVRTGWFHPSETGAKLMHVLTGTGPALLRLSRMMRDPIKDLVRGVEFDSGDEYPIDVRRTSAYADLASAVDELEGLKLELRDPDGHRLEIDSVGVSDTEWTAALVSKKARRQPEARSGVARPETSPRLPRYQIQVRLRGVARRRMPVSGRED